jgi:hypothetical protein
MHVREITMAIGMPRQQVTPLLIVMRLARWSHHSN